MARRKDSPLLQAAKGFPGRRRSAVEKEIEATVEATAKDPVPESGIYPVPSVFLAAPVYWNDAIKVWQEKSGNLKSAGRQRPAYMSGLIRYCIWTQLFIAAVNQLRRDLPKGGVAVKVKKGDGEIVIRKHPSIDFIPTAETALRLLESEYAFTPYSDSNLTRIESFNAAQGRLPFPPGPSHSPGPGDDEMHGDPMDLMTSTDSPPPDRRRMS